jgi:pyruvate-formate lyase-activating enzyme
MRDLPPTPLEQAIRCYKAAKEAGLKNIHVGNLHLLRIYSMNAFEALTAQA